MINIFANSLGIGRFNLRSFGNAPFHSDGLINVKYIGTDWLYYPQELGSALLAQGVESRIYCHSGKILKFHGK